MGQLIERINVLKNNQNFRNWWEVEGGRTCLRESNEKLILEGLPSPGRLRPKVSPRNEGEE